MAAFVSAVLLLFWATEHFEAGFRAGAGCSQTFLFSILSLDVSSGMQGASRRFSFLPAQRAKSSRVSATGPACLRGVFWVLPAGAVAHVHYYIDIDYILVVGHFGLATGSGGKTQSNMHNESCPKTMYTPR